MLLTSKIIKLEKPSAGVVRVIGRASEGIPNYLSHGLNTPEENLVSTVEIIGTVTERERERASGAPKPGGHVQGRLQEESGFYSR
jgi:hypothetical protein